MKQLCRIVDGVGLGCCLILLPIEFPLLLAFRQLGGKQKIDGLIDRINRSDQDIHPIYL